jgi:MoxR-like ATPase
MGLFRWLKRYFLGGGAERADERLLQLQDAADAEPRVTGEGLIQTIYDAVLLRRSVLVTGPRGCGKSYCSDQGIRRALEAGRIGGWVFLQGNREVPRDTLSEDMLVIGPTGKPEPLKALALRACQRRPPPKEYEARLPDALRPALADWPAVPAQAVRSDWDPRKLWTDQDWTVLYLDEINRFGDGFLDSLLSLTEEGKLVRRGEDYFVPMLMVATANPPGYDATAKKLSPPLQARIALSLRVAQPGFEDLVETILRARLSDLAEKYRQPPGELLSDELARLAAATTLCLWGDPDAGGQGAYYLTRETRTLLRRVMALDRALRRAMRTLSTLITFGPDARAVQDWIGCAVGRALGAGEKVELRHLTASAVEVLGHKVRETFNEGAEPAKVALKEHCIAETARCVMTHPDLRELFVPPLRMAAQAAAADADEPSVLAAERELLGRERGLPPARRAPWLRALSRLPRELTPRELNDWRRRAVAVEALTPAGAFFDQEERRWLVELLRQVRGHERAADALAAWPFDHARQLERLIAERPALRPFRPELQALLVRHAGAALSRLEDQEAWVALLQRCLGARAVETAELDAALWQASAELTLAPPGPARAPADVFLLLTDSFAAVARTANPVGRERCRRARRRLEALGQVRLGAAAALLAEGDPSPAAARGALGLMLESLYRPFGLLLRESERAPAWLKAWIDLLAQTPVQPDRARVRELAQRARDSGALLPPRGLFRSPAERQMVLGLLSSLAAGLPPEALRRASLRLFRDQLAGLRCSAAEALRAHFEPPGRPAARRQQERSLALLGEVLDALDDATAALFFGGFIDASARVQQNLEALVRAASALLDPGPDGRDATAAACWRAAFQLCPRDSDPAAYAASARKAFEVLAAALGPLGKAFGRGGPRLTEELLRFDAAALARAADFEVRETANRPARRVGSHSVLKWLGELVEGLTGRLDDVVAAGNRWLRLFGRLPAVQGADELFAALRAEGLLSPEAALSTFVERNWLARVCRASVRPGLAAAADLLTFDVAATAARLASGDPRRAAFLQAGLTASAAGPLLRGGEADRFLAELLRFFDELHSSHSVRTAVRNALRELEGLDVPPGVAARVLRDALTAVAPSDPRARQALKELRPS